ncbi:MAG: hypothetical protein K2F57_01320, partial [Candidatus Gastranaerophilales bacterium]|nr:hypothetical protein [Candidatus Gastranaerophilales bacterium]
MANKEVHVNGYVKRDGTEVSEYYRSAPEGSGLLGNTSGGLFNSNALPEKNSVMDSDRSSIEEEQQTNFPIMPENQNIPPNTNNYQYTPDSVFNSPIGNYLQSQENPAITANPGFNITAIEAEQEVNNVLNSIKYMDKNQMSNSLKQDRINKMLDKLTEAHTKSREVEQKTLDNLVNSPNQQEYQKNYKFYVEIKQNNDLKADNINRIKYAAENNNIPMLYNELNNYKSDFDTVTKEYRQRNPLKNPEKPLSYYTPILQDAINLNSVVNITNPSKFHPKKINNIIDYTKQSIPKYAVDGGMLFYNTLKYPLQINDAKEMWKASSHDFTQSKDYVNKNGALVGSISDLKNKELQNIVRNKVKNSYGAEDSIGMIFNANSNLSKEMANSPEYKKLFLENKNELLNYQVVKNKSSNFSSSKNLELAIRKFDVPYMFVDANGDFCTVAMDA